MSSMLLRVVGVLVGLYAVVVGLAFFFQRSLLYYPSSQRPTEEAVRRLGLRSWPDREDFRGYVGVSPPESPRATAVVFHGNGGAAHDRGYYVDALGRRGLRVVLAEYPGYAGRPGSPSEESIVVDAVETVRRAHEEFGGPLHLWGESLGSGVVAALAGREDLPVAGLVLLTPFDSMVRLARRHYPVLPVGWLLRDRFESRRHLSDYRGPAAVLVAEHDTVVPAQLGRALHESLPGPKRLWTFDGAGHNSWPVAPDRDWWDEVLAFLYQH